MKRIMNLAGIASLTVAFVVLPGFVQLQQGSKLPWLQPRFFDMQQVVASSTDPVTGDCPNWGDIPGVVLDIDYPVETILMLHLVVSGWADAGHRLEAFIEVDGQLLDTNKFAISIASTDQQTGCTEAVITLPAGPHTLKGVWQVNAPGSGCGGGQAYIANQQASLSLLAFPS